MRRITVAVKIVFRKNVPHSIHQKVGDGPNTVSESTVSNTELSELFPPHRVLGRELSEFLSAFYLVCKSELTEFLAVLTEFAQKLSEFSFPKQYARNSIPPVFRGRVNREVQTVNWKVAEKGLSRQASRAAWKRRINRELEAKMAHKLWVRERLNSEVQTVN